MKSKASVEGVVEMRLDATQKFAETLTDERLFAWRDDSNGSMQVGSGPVGKERVHYEALEAKRLSSETTDFLAWFEGGPVLDPVLKAGSEHPSGPRSSKPRLGAQHYGNLSCAQGVEENVRSGARRACHLLSLICPACESACH